MKKLLLLCTVFAMILFSACSDSVPASASSARTAADSCSSDGNHSSCSQAGREAVSSQPSGYSSDETDTSTRPSSDQSEPAASENPTSASAEDRPPAESRVSPMPPKSDKSKARPSSAAAVEEIASPNSSKAATDGAVSSAVQDSAASSATSNAAISSAVPDSTTFSPAASEVACPESTVSDYTAPEEVIVLHADPKEVETLVARYVNERRVEEGATEMTVLAGLTAVAEYRSRQLIQNFDHAMGTAVCTELRYGKFVDMTKHGMSESQNYYQGYNREAIAKGNWGGTAEEIAGRIADGFRNSPSHWMYLGSGEYSYVAVGCTYDEATGMWYCCICLSAKDCGGYMTDTGIRQSRKC